MSRLLLLIHSVIHRLHCWRIPVLPGLLAKIFIRLLFSCQMGPGTKIGKGVTLGYGGLGVVIHNDAVLGDRVHVGANVTIGGTTKQREVPVIGENTMIATGAKVLGPITIGKNCVIGANAVVLIDVPDNSVAVGIPARIVKSDIDINDYR